MTITEAPAGQWTAFNRFWSMQILSQLSFRTATLLFPIIAVTTFNADSSEVGVVNTLLTFPVFVVAVFAGGLLDRWDRRRSIAFSLLACALVLAVLPLADVFGSRDVVTLFVVSVLAGTLIAFVELGCQTLPPDLVRPDMLVAANSRSEVVISLAQVGGPGVAGLLAQLLGGSPALVVTSALCAAAVVPALRLTLAPRAAPQPTRLLTGLATGLRILLGHKVLRVVVLEAAAFNLFEQAVLTLYLVHAVRSWGFSSGLLGLTITLGGLGAVLGPFLVGATRRRLGPARLLVGGIGLASLAPFLIPFAEGSTTLRATFAVIAFFLYGLGLTVFNIFAVSLRQQLAPPGSLGRVSAAYRFLAFGPIAIGAALGGFSGEWLGLRPALLWTSAALALVFFVFLWRAFVIRKQLNSALAELS